ncbi:MAG TPA: hypothetical protein VJL89_00265 [Thermodesulfovibrionia bacterium]|nr:hypothetical protein [Thermodesulfovibrionia bacterium]
MSIRNVVMVSPEIVPFSKAGQGMLSALYRLLWSGMALMCRLYPSCMPA